MNAAFSLFISTEFSLQRYLNIRKYSNKKHIFSHFGEI